MKPSVSSPSVFKLTVNMRLGLGSSESERKEIQDISDWILDIGNGNIGCNNDGDAVVEFPEDMLIANSKDHVGSIIQQTYPDLVDNLNCPAYFQEREILAPTHELVDVINDRMLSLIPSEEKVYKSSDSISVLDMDAIFDEQIYTTDFLHNIEMSGLHTTG